MNIHAFLEELLLYRTEYLAGLPDDDGEEVYDSYRGLATDELAKFIGWLRLRAEAVL